MSKPEIVRRSDLPSLTCVSWRQMTSMWWISASGCMVWRFAADNPSTLSCMMHRAGPTAWKPRSALSEEFFLALWQVSIRIQSAGGIFGFPRLVYSPRYSWGGRRGCSLPSPPVNTAWSNTFVQSCVLNKLATYGAFLRYSDFRVETFYFASPCSCVRSCLIYSTKTRPMRVITSQTPQIPWLLQLPARARNPRYSQVTVSFL